MRPMTRLTSLSVIVLTTAMATCAPLTVQLSHATPKSCTALVNVKTQGQYQHFELMLSQKKMSAALPHVALGSFKGNQSAKMIIQSFKKSQETRSKFGPLSENWVELKERSAEKAFFSSRIDCDPPNAKIFAPFECDSEVAIIGIFGPILSLYISEGGFTGGAHGFDYQTYKMLSFDAAPLIEGSHYLSTSLIKRARQRAESEGFESDPPTPNRETLAHTAIAINRGEAELNASLFCCTWVENHNQWTLQLELKANEVHDSIGRWLPRKGVWRSNQGCGALRFKGQTIEMQSAADQPWTTLGVLPKDSTLLGVSWVGPHPPPSAMIDERHANMLANDAFQTLKGGDAKRSKSMSLAALKMTNDDKLRGAILYNIGRAHEAERELDEAIKTYQRSLQLRPNRTTQKRLRSLQSSLKSH